LPVCENSRRTVLIRKGRGGEAVKVTFEREVWERVHSILIGRAPVGWRDLQTRRTYDRHLAAGPSDIDKAFVEIADRLTPLIVEREDYKPAPLELFEDWPPVYRFAIDTLESVDR
jgi:hypothetical protein